MDVMSKAKELKIYQFAYKTYEPHIFYLILMLLRLSVKIPLRSPLLQQRRYSSSSNTAVTQRSAPVPNTNPRAVAKELSGKILINGELRAARASGALLDISHPATKEVFGNVPLGK